MKKKTKYYAYLVGSKQGIVNTWDECQSIVSGNQAKYKSFETKEEAQKWLDLGADYSIKRVATQKGIFFDAGTGGGQGVEINVTNENGDKLLVDFLDVNEKGHHLVKGNASNNYGELLACKYALEIAIKQNIKKVFGDSKLILDFWSKGYIKKSVGEETLNLASQVKKLRRKFEKQGGKLLYISGGSNPADLGFHRP